MIKPKRLEKGDKIAIVSLSSGILGEEQFIHKYYIAKERLENDFGLEVETMPNALKGVDYIYNHPEARAKDLMDAFGDTSIKAIFSSIGGDDTIRILPYIDFDIIKNNPKIFMGYSDTTVNHLMMYKAGLCSFYGPSIMAEFAEYGSMIDYVKEAVKKVLFEDSKGYKIKSSELWTNDHLDWCEENIDKRRKLIPEQHGYEVIQGKGKVTGHLLGGCLDAFVMYTGTDIWPKLDDWKGAILFIETSEDEPSPDMVRWLLRNMASQGIIQAINGIIVGKPKDEVYYEEYKDAIKDVVAIEEKRPDLPILYNVNFGHSSIINVLPYGIQTELNCDNKTITFLESATI